MNLEAKIEALLFFKAEPITLDWLSKKLEISPEEIKEGIETLSNSLQNRGLTVIENNNLYSIGTDPEMSTLIEDINKEELKKDLGKAGLETLAIIIYKSPVSKATLDYIRGVNSNYILRNLSIRDLIQKIPSPEDKRKTFYAPSLKLLNFLGLRNFEELPNYNENKEAIEKILNNQEDE